MNNIVNEVIKRVQYLLPYVEVTTEHISKNNDVIRTGVVLKSKDRRIAPVFYIDDMIRDGWSTDRMAFFICKSFQENDGSEMDFVANYLSDFTNIENMLTLQLVNRDMNMALWDNVPYEPFLDLAAMVIIDLEESTHCRAVIKVTYQMLQYWNITFEEVYHKAYLNLLKEQVYLSNIANTMAELGYQDEDGLLESIPMYILSNQNHIHGATMILREHLLKELVCDSGCDLIVIPSSVHEFILIPTQVPVMFDKEQLDEMVRMVNHEEVDDTEILSNHIYLYKRNGGWYNFN